MSASILIVEDEEPLQVLLSYNLEAEGYRPRTATTGERCRSSSPRERPDLIILDWMLPGISGIEVCRLLRQRAETRDILIVMLTARGEEPSGCGARDRCRRLCGEAVLRSRADGTGPRILRRANPDAVADMLRAGDISLDRRNRRVTRGSRDINLSPTEFRLLEHLMQSPAGLQPGPAARCRVGRDIYIDERTVDACRRLRRPSGRGREPIRSDGPRHGLLPTSALRPRNPRNPQPFRLGTPSQNSHLRRTFSPDCPSIEPPRPEGTTSSFFISAMKGGKWDGLRVALISVAGLTGLASSINLAFQCRRHSPRSFCLAEATISRRAASRRRGRWRSAG